MSEGASDIEIKAAHKANEDLGDVKDRKPGFLGLFQRRVHRLSTKEGDKILDTYESAQMANRDVLTKLYNRKGITEEFEVSKSALDRNNDFVNYGIVVMDLIGLKALNQELGHSGADKVLVDASEALKKELRKSDLIGRWGGDEFVVVVFNTSDDHLQNDVIKKINNNLPDGVKYCIGFKTYQKDDDINKSLDEATNLIEEVKKQRPHDESGRVIGDGVVVGLNEIINV